MKNQTREELKKEISDLKEQHKKDLLLVHATGKGQGAINMALLIGNYIKETLAEIPREKPMSMKAVPKDKTEEKS